VASLRAGLTALCELAEDEPAGHAHDGNSHHRGP